MFTVDREVQVSIPMTPWVSRSFLAVPGRDYDAALEEGVSVPKFRVTFVGPAADEEVEASDLVDRPPFVDFVRIRGPKGSESSDLVARFKADDIDRVLRESD
jgi:hypothetical protein